MRKEKIIPNMIYGTAWKKEKTNSLVKEAITCGFRAIDTACQPKHYSEELVGLGLQEALSELNLSRNDIFLQTKFTPINGQDLNNMPYNQNDDVVVALEKSFETSLINLRTDYIDSYLIHSPFGPAEDFVRVYQKMEEYVNKGLIGQIGISNCYEMPLLEFIYNNAKIKPKVVQNRFYKDSGYDQEIRNYCNLKEITYQSFWSLTANPHLLSSMHIISMANKYGKTIPQVFYRFLNQINITPLNGTTKKEHMLEDLDFLSFKLTNEEIQTINNLLTSKTKTT